jgi:malate synthase
MTRQGLEINLDVGLQYLAAWLGGNGCVPIYNLMEDAATAEICRAQVWQWLRHGVFTDSQVRDAMQRTLHKLHGNLPERELDIAARLYAEMLDTSGFLDFLTLRAYDYIE